jgi:porin
MAGYRPSNRVDSALAACAALAIGAHASAGAGPEDDDGALANVPESALDMAGPGDLPGREPGPRIRPAPQPAKPAAPAPATPPAPPAPAEPVALRDWFGHRPYWEWSRATGDWGGTRTRLEEIGLTFAGSYTLDWSSVWSGGINNRASTRSLLDLNLTLDTLPSFGLEGGTLYIDFQSTDMRGGPEDTGTFMATSSLETGDNVDQISELWYQQIFAEGLLRLRAGKIDAGLEFGYTAPAENFIHASNVLLYTNGVIPTYPDPAMGVELFVYPTENIYIGAGAFDGSLSAGVHTGRQGPAPLWNGNEYFFIAEAGITWKDLGSLGPGKFAAGGWGHTGDFTDADGSTSSGTGAGYFMVNQRLLARDAADPENEGGLVAFLSAGFADGDVSDSEIQVTTGLTLNGTFDGRDEDVTGLLFTWLDLSDERGFDEDESALELMYKFQLTPFIAITPAMQYIWNPSGDPTIDDVFAGVVRFEIEF